ncbi:MAG: hypothetical protein AAF208_10555 [Cyanobacteria bacterium P01_A01_bin.45]
MLKTTKKLQTPTVQNFLSLWEQRYKADLSSSNLTNPPSYSLLIATSSFEGRSLTATKMKDKFLSVNCQMAWIQTKNLYSYIPNILDLQEARRITQFSFRIYRKLLEIYQNQSHKTEILSQSKLDVSLVELITPDIEDLAYSLEPILLVFQEQHVASKDWRSLGFMTTQLNFCNQLILKKLQPQERILLAPYLKFVEEQVSMPWQRVCANAARYKMSSPRIHIVEHIFSHASELAEKVYQRLVSLLPNYYSRRGNLSDAPIRYSCIRDLNMFQAYLCLCLLEDSLKSIEIELLPLCAMVVEGVDIKWEVTKTWCKVLAEELENSIDAEYIDLLIHFTQGMKNLFFRERRRLGYTEDRIVQVR